MREYHKHKTAFSKDPEWKAYFKVFRETLSNMAKDLRIPEEEQANPKLIPYWKHPYDLQEEQTASRQFLRYLNKWLYHDTSAQAHLSCGGLIMMAPFLLAEDVEGQKREMIEGRMMQQYRYQHISRTTIVTLAIMSEMDAFFGLNNTEQLKYIWTILENYSEEAKEIVEHRYNQLWDLRSASNPS